MTNSDLSKLFEKIGRLKRCGLHWNENGQIKGTADVEFVYPEDARKAKEEYDGKLNKIEFYKFLLIFLGKPLGGRPLVITWATNSGNNRRIIRKRLGVRRTNLTQGPQSNNNRNNLPRVNKNRVNNRDIRPIRGRPGNFQNGRGKSNGVNRGSRVFNNLDSRK